MNANSNIAFISKMLELNALDILLSSNPNINKSLYGLCFWASGP